ncbi:MAG: hypothetical protein AAFZ05_12735 [Pseudomonadota bacterium]
MFDETGIWLAGTWTHRLWPDHVARALRFDEIVAVEERTHSPDRDDDDDTPFERDALRASGLGSLIVVEGASQRMELGADLPPADRQWLIRLIALRRAQFMAQRVADNAGWSCTDVPA